MLAKLDLARLIDYTVWANHRAMRAAATLSPDDFKRDIGSSHGGVRGTLAHILGAEWIWLERWKGVSPPRGVDEGELPDVLALRDRWRGIEEHRAAWFRALPEAAVSATVQYTTFKGAEQSSLLWKLVQHVANHSTFHRGQVITLLRLLGATPLTTDMAAWDLEHPEGGALTRGLSS